MDRCKTRSKEEINPEPCGENVAVQPEFLQLKFDQSVLRRKELKFNVKATVCAQIGDNNKAVVTRPSHKNKKPFLQLTKIPDLPICVGRRMSRTRSGFPDKNDHEFTVAVYKNNIPDLKEKLDIEYCNSKKKGKKYIITPSVELCGQSGKTEVKPKFQVKQLKRDANKIGETVFVFRFHDRQAKLLIKFRLETVPAQGSSKNKREFLDEIAVEVETVNGETRRAISRNKTKGDTVYDNSERYSASGSDVCEKETEILSVVLFHMQQPSRSETSDKLMIDSYKIMKELHPSRDNGRWDEFYTTADRLYNEYVDTDSRIAIQLERSVAACYRDDLDGSAKMIEEVLHTLKDRFSAVNTYQLAGRALCYQAGVYRRQKKLGAAQHCVDIAEQCLYDTGTNMDRSFLAYEQGSIDLELMAHESNLNPQHVVRVKENLEKCIDICFRLEQNDDTQLYVKKHHFALIKVSMLLLDCRSTAGRQRAITADSIQEAKAGLDTLEERYWNDIAEGEKIQFYLGRADQFFRNESYTRSKEFVQKALDMASILNFNTEIEPARARLQAIEAKLPKEPSVESCAPSNLTLESSSSVTVASPAELTEQD